LVFSYRIYLSVHFITCNIILNLSLVDDDSAEDLMYAKLKVI
jgi:hypothetical protein